MKTKQRLLLVAISILFLFSCQNNEQINYSEKINIGFIGPLTGPVADIGAEMLNSAQLALQTSKPQYPNLNFTIIPQDDGMNATQAATKAKSLIEQNNCIAIIGAGTTSQVKAEISALKGKNIPLITPTATESDLTNLGNNIFRVIPSNTAQAEALVNFLNSKNIKKVGLTFQLNDDYSIDLKNIFSELFKKIGGSIVNEIGFESDETDFKAQLSMMKNSDIEAIVCFAQHVQVSRVVLRAHELNIIKPILSGETAFTDKLLATVGFAKNLYITGVAVEKNTVREQYEKLYLEKYGKKPGPYGVYTYDAVKLAIHTIATNMPINGNQLIDNLKKLRAFSGASGLVVFNERGDVNRKYEIFKLENNQFIKAE